MRAYNAVAGNNQRDRIAADSLPDSLRGTATDHSGYFAIGLGLAVIDSEKRLPDLALKVRSGWIELRQLARLSAGKIIIQPFPHFRYYRGFFSDSAGLAVFRLVRKAQTRERFPVAFNNDCP